MRRTVERERLAKSDDLLNCQREIEVGSKV